MFTNTCIFRDPLPLPPSDTYQIPRKHIPPLPPKQSHPKPHPNTPSSSTEHHTARCNATPSSFFPEDETDLYEEMLPHAAKTSMAPRVIGTSHGMFYMPPGHGHADSPPGEDSAGNSHTRLGNVCLKCGQPSVICVLH